MVFQKAYVHALVEFWYHKVTDQSHTRKKKSLHAKFYLRLKYKKRNLEFDQCYVSLWGQRFLSTFVDISLASRIWQIHRYLLNELILFLYRKNYHKITINDQKILRTWHKFSFLQEIVCSLKRLIWLWKIFWVKFP